MAVVLQSDLLYGAVLRIGRARPDPISARWCPAPIRVGPAGASSLAVLAATTRNGNGNVDNKHKKKICTADELHYVAVSESDWHLALWRYLPSPKGPKRNHPLLLLSGVGTNAIGYDLSPESSFARFMSGQGFDTWILEVRGAGLSTPGMESTEVKQPCNEGKSSPTLQPSKLQGRLSTSVEEFQRELNLIVKNDWDFDHYLEEDVPAVVR